MIKPTIGRVVLIKCRAGRFEDAQAEPALVTHVWNDEMINVGGFDWNGNPFAITSLTLIQDGVAQIGSLRAEWMPYQKKVAAEQS